MKVVIVGDMSTGKSSILYRLLKNEPLDEGFPTVGVEVGSRSFFLRNSNVHVQFWDTAGQERFRSVCHQHYKGAHAAIIVFDLGNRTTFESLPGWLQRTRELIQKSRNTASDRMLLYACWATSWTLINGKYEKKKLKISLTKIE